MIPTDDFFDLKITKDTMLDAYLIDNYLDMQLFYKAFELMKKRVFSNDYTSYQMVQYGKKYLGLDEDQALDIIHEFMERHWIDDKEYAFDKAQAWHSYGQPKMQICQKLKRAGIADDVIEDALASLDVETERNNAIKLARRLAHSLKEQSSRMQRQTLVNKLVTKGYSFELAKQVSESIELSQSFFVVPHHHFHPIQSTPRLVSPIQTNIPSMMMRHYKERLRKRSVYMRRLISLSVIRRFSRIIGANLT